MSTPAQKASDLLKTGVQHLQSGRLTRAEQCFRKLLKLDPGHVDGLAMLGAAENMSGRHDHAAGLLERALDRNPQHLGAIYNLGVARQAQGRPDAALTLFDKAAVLAPRFFEAAFNRAVTLQSLERHEEAETRLREVAATWPGVAEVHNQMGSLLIAGERWTEAEASLREALRLRAGFAGAWNNLGVALRGQGRTEEAAQAFARAIEAEPDSAGARRNLARALFDLERVEDGLSELAELADRHPKDGAVLAELGAALLAANRLTDAQTALRRAIDHGGATAPVYRDLGRTLTLQQKLAEAEEVLRRAVALSGEDADLCCALADVELRTGRPSQALERLRGMLTLRPDLPAVHAGQGAALQALGDHEAALTAFAEAARLAPDDLGIVSAVLFTLCYHDGTTLARFAEAGRRVQATLGEAPRLAPAEPLSPLSRPLRIGYVSPDLCRHSVSHFLLPLLENHDREAVRIHLYSDVVQPDAVTGRCAALADVWKDTAVIGDERLARIIAADGIDILVDLAGHTTDNRLGLFNRKPAPVQVSWLGYGATSGVAAIDYYLCDDVLLAPDSAEWFAETPWRLPRCSFAFEPLTDAPDCAPPPALREGRITFGSFNNGAKITAATVRLWSSVLRAVPDSRLLLKTRQLADSRLRDRLLAAFAAEGIGSGRLSFRTHSAGSESHLAAYGEIDIALDTSPYNGATTTCEALYMGVPVISLATDRLVGRYGASILAAIGLGDLVASDATGFTDAARTLAADISGLAELRNGLRPRFLASPLGDGAGLARAMEEAFRDMWRRDRG
ncbi:tetratricopeptide repeat protein [Telmatospirillum siberiense]|uniref:protein O-GlcNAc transferase n=1 Tax=Telmatospirillum siberiense TaxID=382514 RepID=A0A2N3PVA9_9PROT|nr:tetratricopeptide repeat protein [Telmatospirillum siberiense]PKU24343.1 hypothetical protein CWS72_12180 [Telmatospirillum siberiense]